MQDRKRFPTTGKTKAQTFGRAKQKKLKDAIVELKVNERVVMQDSFSKQMAREARRAVAGYIGDNQMLRFFARKAMNPQWLPSPTQTVQIHRLIHQRDLMNRNGRVAPRPVTRDSLGNRLREREYNGPSSLDEPDWV